MNFLIFRDFSRIFLIFFGFIWTLKLKKKFVISRVDVAGGDKVLPCGDICVHTCARVCMCAQWVKLPF